MSLPDAPGARPGHAGPVTVIASSVDADRPPRRWPWVAGGILLVVGAVVAAADAPLRDREAAALADSAAEVREAATRADRLVASRVAYASPLLTAADVDPVIRADLQALVGDGAATGAADLRAARDALADVVLLPWHGDLAEARAATLAVADARIAALLAVADDATARTGLVDVVWPPLGQPPAT